MKVHSKEIYSKRTICDFILMVTNNLTVGKIFSCKEVENLHFCPLHSDCRPITKKRQAIAYQHNLYITEKYFQWATILLLTIWIYLRSFSRCCLPNLQSHAKSQNSKKIWMYSSSRLSPWCQLRAHMQLPISH